MRCKYAGKADAGPPQPLEITRQPQLEQLKQLMDIFACIFDSLTLEQRANRMLAEVEQEAA